MPEVRSLVNDSRVYGIDGPMCRWSLKARGIENRVHEEAEQDDSRVPRKLLKYFVEVDGNATRDLFT